MRKLSQDRILIWIIVAQFAFGLLAVMVREYQRWTAQDIVLALDPMDPRSLMQGDYLVLNYGLARQVGAQVGGLKTRRFQAILTPSGNEYVFEKIYNPKTDTLQTHQRLITGSVNRYRGVSFGIEHFFIPEGTGAQYQSHRYAHIKLTGSGDAFVVDVLTSPTPESAR